MLLLLLLVCITGSIATTTINNNNCKSCRLDSFEIRFGLSTSRQQLLCARTVILKSVFVRDFLFVCSFVMLCAHLFSRPFSLPLPRSQMHAFLFIRFKLSPDLLYIPIFSDKT